MFTDIRAYINPVFHIVRKHKTFFRQKSRFLLLFGNTCSKHATLPLGVKKYDASGEEGLSDKRGRHKTDDEVDELERLRRENLRLKRQLEEKDMVVELLKKVKEFERM